MGYPYETCEGCIVKGWCRKVKGEVEAVGDVCNANFILYRALELSNIPETYLNANMHNMDISSYSDAVVNEFSRLIDEVVPFVEGGNQLYIYGTETGVGKTFTAFTLLNQYLYKACMSPVFDFENPLVHWVSYTDLMDMLRYEKKEETTEQMIEIVKNVPLLLIDDIGAGTVSNYTREQTYSLLNYRVMRNKATIYTSNFPVEILRKAEFLGHRTISRILNKGTVIELKGNDKRLESIVKVVR